MAVPGGHRRFPRFAKCKSCGQEHMALSTTRKELREEVARVLGALETCPPQADGEPWDVYRDRRANHNSDARITAQVWLQNLYGRLGGLCTGCSRDEFKAEEADGE